MAIMNGVSQWVFQRATNVLLVAFGVVLLLTLLDGISYLEMTSLLDNTLFKVFAVVTLIMGCLNSILAGWQIVGDYARKFHLPPSLMMIFIIAVSVAYLVFGFKIIF